MLTLVATVTKQIKQANSENKNILFCLPFQSIVVIFVAFLPHDAMQARPMLSCSVCLSICLSVRLSVTFVNSVKTSIFNFFSPSGSQTIVVIALPNIMAIFRRDPPNGGVECRWDRQKSRFWANSWLSIDCCQRCDRLGVINTAPPDRGKL